LATVAKTTLVEFRGYALCAIYLSNRVTLSNRVNQWFIALGGLKMNKSELIDKVASDVGISKVQADRAIKAVIDAITETLKKGDPVALIGFGNFKVSLRQARVGLNPQTGAKMDIPEKRVVRFAAGSKLQAAVNPAEAKPTPETKAPAAAKSKGKPSASKAPASKSGKKK
jgi:DNA-binding protein HU-beta